MSQSSHLLLIRRAARRLGPFSAFEPAEVPYNWRSQFIQKDAWQLRELAQLCCGWVPAEPSMWIARDPKDPRLIVWLCGTSPDALLRPICKTIENAQKYDSAIDLILRATRVGLLHALQLKWPSTLQETSRHLTPLFSPKEAAPWASDRFPAFPFTRPASDLDTQSGVSLDPATQMTLGQRLQAFREQTSLGVEELAVRMELDKSTVVSHIRNKSQPRPVHVRKYAEVFSAALGRQVNVSELTGNYGIGERHRSDVEGPVNFLHIDRDQTDRKNPTQIQPKSDRSPTEIRRRRA